MIKFYLRHCIFILIILGAILFGVLVTPAMITAGFYPWTSLFLLMIGFVTSLFFTLFRGKLKILTLVLGVLVFLELFIFLPRPMN